MRLVPSKVGSGAQGSSPTKKIVHTRGCALSSSAESKCAILRRHLDNDKSIGERRARSEYKQEGRCRTRRTSGSMPSPEQTTRPIATDPGEAGGRCVSGTVELEYPNGEVKPTAEGTVRQIGVRRHQSSYTQRSWRAQSESLLSVESTSCRCRDRLRKDTAKLCLPGHRNRRPEAPPPVAFGRVDPGKAVTPPTFYTISAGHPRKGRMSPFYEKAYRA